MGLKTDIKLIATDKKILNLFATKYHYLKKSIPDRALPFGWSIEYKGHLFQPDGKPNGFIIFSKLPYTKLRNEFGYEGLPTAWQALNLARLWTHDNLPENNETCVISKALKLVQRRWIDVHPPPYPNQPYHILKIISYCDTRYHRGTIYRAANFRYDQDVISPTRNHNNRGKGSNGATLIRFIFDLKNPNWEYKPKQMKLF